MRAIQEEENFLFPTREKIAETGAEAAAQLQAAVLFDVTEVRPLIDIPLKKRSEEIL